MPEINIEADLEAVSEQIGKLVEELNKVNQARESLVQQIQNLNGVGMYLRGKINSPEAVMDGESVERSMGIPDATS